MNVLYNSFSKTFSRSRKNLRWEEIDYFLDNYFSLSSNGEEKKRISILDVGCGNARLLTHIGEKYDLEDIDYIGIDLSKGMLEEAKEIYPEEKFIELNMINLHKLPDILEKHRDELSFDYIFFIASFHHLQFIDDRMDVLKSVKRFLKKGGYVFMTNWALDSKLNYEKYTNSIIEGSKNPFGSTDYNVYIGEYPRFYHCFSIEELEFLFKENHFEIIENRLFDSNKNYISISKNTGA